MIYVYYDDIYWIGDFKHGEIGFEKFNYKKDAEEFICERMNNDPDHNSLEQYIIIEGERLGLKEVSRISKVEIN